MDKELYIKYIKFTSRQEIHRNPKIKGCPTPDCEGILDKPEFPFIEVITCQTCEKEYCFKCLHPPHTGETCEEKIDADYEEWATPNA